MKSHSLDWLYGKLEKQIKLVESYTEINGISNVIKACRLKPHSYIFENQDDRIILHRWWFDEFGNSLRLKKKKPKLSLNDLLLDRNRIVCTDIYRGLSLYNVCKISKSLLVCVGKDEETYEDCYLIAMLGLDNYVRCYLYSNYSWQAVSPLLMGLDYLIKLCGNDVGRPTYYLELKSSENISMPCLTRKAWLTYLPVRDELLEKIKRDHKILYGLLTNENT